MGAGRGRPLRRPGWPLAKVAGRRSDRPDQGLRPARENEPAADWEVHSALSPHQAACRITYGRVCGTVHYVRNGQRQRAAAGPPLSQHAQMAPPVQNPRPPAAEQGKCFDSCRCRIETRCYDFSPRMKRLAIRWRSEYPLTVMQ